jgi:hypothetical protein
MARHDYGDLRADVELWSSYESEALDRWEKAEWKAYDEDPEGRYFDTIGDTAGQYFQSSTGKKDEMLGLIVLAEEAEKAGDTEEADRLVKEVRRHLNAGSSVPEPVVAALDVAAGFDPDPPDIPDISLLDDAEHDYEALMRAVDRWRDAEERDIDRWEAEREREYDKDPANHYADTIGDGAGYRWQQVQSQAEDFKEQVRRAAACEQRGDMTEADQLVAELRDAIGVSDEAMPQIESYLDDAARKGASRRRTIIIIWAILAVAGIVAALFNVLG